VNVQPAMMALLLRPTRGGGGGGSSDPPAGSEGGVRWQLSGTGAGSGPQASVVRSRVLPLQRCFGSPVVAARDVGGACCGLGTARVAVQCLRVCRSDAGGMGGAGGRWRGRELGAFSAPQSPIFHSRVQPPLLCLDAPPAPSLAPPRAARRSIRPLCGSAGCLTYCHECALCLRMARRKGRGRRASGFLVWASFRGHRDRDDGGQDADGGGAEQRRLDFYRDQADGGFGDVSGDVRFD
jgi:hypothetical protein